MKILGISAFYHDAAAALVIDGQVIAAAQEERFTRKKHDPGFPREASRFCLEHAGLRVDELDAIAFYDKPFIKFERLLETYYAFAPKGVGSFITSMPVWIREKLNLKKMLKDELSLLPGYDKRKLNLLFPEHHLSHAASAYYPSPFDSAAILTIDGVGEWATASICHGTGKDIKILRELRFPHSLGLLYSAFTYFLGFKVNSGEYKLMGLAPYGDPDSEEVLKFERLIRENLVKIHEDGSLWLDQKWFRYATGLRMSHDGRWESLFGFPRRLPEDELKMHHCNLGLAIQRITEEVVMKMASEAKRLTGERNLCLAGGVALNCVSNGKLQKAGIFENLFIQPAAGDAGGAPGAAWAAAHIYYGEERPALQVLDRQQGSYLGPHYVSKEIELTARKYKAVYEAHQERSELYTKVAQLLDEGKVIGWVQGRMEFGPRALGARSILGDARNPEMQKKLNLKIKFRESFRPFAPSVLAEDVQEYFDYAGVSPYMLLVHPVKESRRKPLPEGYASLPLREKLYHLRSDLPAITHIDYSARIQTVHRETNPEYHALISAFKKRTGYGILVNTSFNVRGEPIVCTPEDAYRCFMRTEMDYLVVENYLFDKALQPAWKNDDGWKEEFVLD